MISQRRLQSLQTACLPDAPRAGLWKYQACARIKSYALVHFAKSYYYGGPC